MAEDNQITPLTPMKLNPRSDEEFASLKPINPRQQKTSKFLVYFLAGIVIFSTVFLVFALIVMRPRSPYLEMSSVSVKNLVYTNKTASFSSFNMTVEAEFTIENTNFGKFEFENATVTVLYIAETVGKAIIGDGRVGARETEKIRVKVHVRSDTEKLSKDGILKLSSHAKFRGKVQPLQIVKTTRTGSIDCSMGVNMESSALEVQDLICS